MNRLFQLWQLTMALYREILREPGVLFWGIIFPILMSLGLGVAFTKKSDVIRKVAIISPAINPPETDSSSVLLTFLENNAEEATSDEKESYDWKLVMKDEKLGNSVFLFYELAHLRSGSGNY